MTETTPPTPERPSMEADIVCVGFGPATAGFLTRLSREITNPDGTPRIESAVAPGMPLQVICYERSDDLSFGVSGVVSKARAIRETLPELDPAQIPMAARVEHEEIVYLLDPTGASRRPALLRAADLALRTLRVKNHAFKLPWIPPFLKKHQGLILSMGQFMQWVGGQVMASGAAQVWPSSPVAKAIIEENRVAGVRLMDQGTDKQGRPEANFSPGMDVRAALTVIADGPVGAVGAQLDEHFGLPKDAQRHDWAVGMKFVVNLPEKCDWKPGTVIHTFGYPEPEIFGFLYVHPDRVASLGIFVPSWFDSPVRTAYRYLQHWMLHPWLWRNLEGGALRSWGAKTLQESGQRGEPKLTGDGYARIGEGSGSTNVLTGSGVDEAWGTGTLLAEAVTELLRAKKPFTRENLDRAYVSRRRASWVEKEARVARRARDGFHTGMVTGMFGMTLAAFSGGRLALPVKPRPTAERLPTLEKWFEGRIPSKEIAALRKECAAKGTSLHGALMDRSGWPAIPHDGKLLVSHQDALLLGGKVQAPGGYADHVAFLYPNLCESCENKVCIELCSGQAIMPGPEGKVPAFDREKCVHCGACLWNCSKTDPKNPERGLISFCAGTGGLHSAEN